MEHATLANISLSRKGTLKLAFTLPNEISPASKRSQRQVERHPDDSANSIALTISPRNEGASAEPFHVAIAEKATQPTAYTVLLNTHEHSWHATYWDAYAFDGADLHPLAIPRQLKAQLKVRCIQTILPNGHILFPHITREGNLAFTQRETKPFDRPSYRRSELAAYLVCRLAGKAICVKRPWLVYEKFCERAQDNGAAFFHYCMSNLPESERKRIFYVIDKSSPDYENVRRWDSQVLDFMSCKHLVYAACAELFVASESRMHAYAWRAKPGLMRHLILKTPLLFLQHGVMALKRVDDVFGAQGEYPADYFLVSSKQEQDIIVDNFGYPPEHVPILGLARWDALSDTSSPERPLILIAPTWRPWLENCTEQEFLASPFYRAYAALLQDDALLNACDLHSAELTLYLHPRFKHFTRLFETIPHARIVHEGDLPLSSLIRQCNALVTDYSSVTWDAARLDKPVLFYQFDSEDYDAHVGSYIDFETQLPGKRFASASQLAEELISLLEHGCIRSPDARARAQHWFAYQDSDNCRRIYNFARSIAGKPPAIGTSAAQDATESSPSAQPELCASFAIPHCRNSYARKTLTLSGIVTIRTDRPVESSSIRLVTGNIELPAEIILKSQTQRPGNCVMKIRLRAELPVRMAESLPIHNALRLAYADETGAQHLTSIRWIAGLSKYLALRGPYYIDRESGLTLYFRQNVPKGTTLTVRHTNVTDTPLAHAKLVAAWAASNAAIWINPVLVFEKNARHYEESGRCIFERMVDDGYRDVYFVINHDAADGLDVDRRYRDRFVYQHSFRHYLYFFRCTRFLGTEALGHAIELRCQSILTQRKTKSPRNQFVFMQHGVMYMVSLDSPERASFRKKNMPGHVRIVASSEAEARHFIDMAGFERGDIIVCGLPKFDRSQLDADADKILVMPTWRPWEFAAMRTDAASTSYAKMITRIAEAIPAHLRDRVVVAPHPLFDPSLFTQGNSPAIGTQSYDELLRKTKLLITDYSSIAYDAFYRGANVVFYWEELDECMERYGAPTHLMIDEKTTFGPVCHTAEQLARACEQAYSSPQATEYVERYRRIVEHHDGHNTDRLIEALKEAGFLSR